MNLRGPAPRTAAVLLGLLVAGCAAVELIRTGAPLEALEAGLAGLIAGGVIVLALSLPGLSWRGAAIGGVVVTTGMAVWTLMDHPLLIWVVTGAGGALFAVLSYPWLRDLPWLPRLGGFWLGVAYWLLGIVGAILALRLQITAERVAYGGVAVLAVLAVIASVHKRRAANASDLTVGICAAFLVAVAVLLVDGAGNMFDRLNPVPDGAWGHNMAERFWGGEHVLYHPNSLALIAVVVAIRIGPDLAFAAWQRIAAVGLAGLIVYLTESRTAFGVAVLAALLHGYLVWRGRLRYADRRVGWTAVALPFVVLALVLVASGGQGFLYKKRYGGDDITSGRTATWGQVLSEWRTAGIGDKLFGDTQSTRAVVVRNGNRIPTDNSAVGALRRSGVLGVLAFVLGLFLLVRRALPGLRSDPGTDPGAGAGGDLAAGRAPPWFGMLVVAMLPAIAVTDWFLGSTGATLWIMFVAAEAALVVTVREAVGAGQLGAGQLGAGQLEAGQLGAGQQ